MQYFTTALFVHAVASKSVADLGLAAWGGRREFQGGAENSRGCQID